MKAIFLKVYHARSVARFCWTLPYVESLAKRYRIDQAKLYETPMEQNLKLEPAEEIDEKIKYINLIGALLFISSGTRFDISSVLII